MWRNTDVAAFVDWMRGHNEAIADPERRAGFYGLDIYNMRGSIAAVLSYLDKVDPEAAARRARALRLPDALAEGAVDLRPRGADRRLPEVRAGGDRAVPRPAAPASSTMRRQDGEGFLDAAQNARLIASAERYYRIMYYGGAESWNLRDTHMFETLEHLLEARGPESKAVVWAHNSHIGDARYTDMGAGPRRAQHRPALPRALRRRARR